MARGHLLSVLHPVLKLMYCIIKVSQKLIHLFKDSYTDPFISVYNYDL